ncbi:hypothetical protein SAMN05216251_13060 [Actinacidiphila alni]|uniref:Hemerythrin-like domain-containing protein n=1 Tax=Actinacidiphila alni TaxID=380248 RepID=A0A1I2LQC1_9ACTN|nr:hypothetical protein [Actinacidiphila alni]SFF81702.1 hypothetical protein SAMN05216251_13060 [Actinacidiphila alni]
MIYRLEPSAPTPTDDGRPTPRTGMSMMHLMNKQYLRELSRYRLLLSRGTRVPDGRAGALLRWWDTLTEVMAVHHDSVRTLFLPLLAAEGSDAGLSTASVKGRFASLDASREEAERKLRAALETDGPLSSAHFSLIRFHEEMAAAAAWEEREILARADRTLTADDWNRAESYLIATQAAQDRLDFVLPWLCTGLSTDQADLVLPAFPEPLLRTYRKLWLPEFEEFSALAWPEPPVLR